MPLAAFASASAGLRASGSFGLKTIALTPLAIRFADVGELARRVGVAMVHDEAGEAW